MKKKALIIARAFPPIKAIATERISKITRSFSLENWEVTVITINDKDIKESFYDFERMSFIDNYNIKIIRTEYSFKECYHIYKSEKNIITIIKKIIGRLFSLFGIDDSFGWIPSLHKTINNLTKEENYDLIVASGSPFLPFYIPYKIFKNNRVPYILDFRDLWSEQPHGKKNFLRKYIEKTLEKKFMDNASLITTVSEGCKEKLSLNTITKNIEVIYNIPDKDYIEEILSLKEEKSKFIDKSFFNLVFTGALYEGRDLTAITKALNLMKKDFKKKLKFHYFGGNGYTVEKNFEKFGLKDLLINHGRVPKKEALIALHNSNALISVIHNDIVAKDDGVKGIITTKIFDYIIANKPIINIAPENGEIRVLLKSLNVMNIYSFTSNQTDQIVNVITNLITSKIENIKTDINNIDWHNEFVKKILQKDIG